MSSRPARPRRSEPKSYVDLFKPLDLGLSSSSDTDDDAPAPGEGKAASPATANKKKKKKLKLPVSDDDDSDISEWEAPNPTTKDGKPASSSEDDDADAGSAVETDDSDGPAEEFDSDDSGFRSPADAPPARGRGRGGHSPKLKHAAAGEGKPRVSVATPSTPSRLKPTSRRLPPPADLPPSLIEVTLSTIGPQYEPPIRKFVANASNVVEGEVEQRSEGADDGMRMRGLEGWALTPFGPERGGLQDMGWWKGKWGERGMREKWGGWYEEVAMEVGEMVEEGAVLPYLPHLVFPSIPSKIHLPRHLLTNPRTKEPSKEPEAEEPPALEDDEAAAEEEQAKEEAGETLKVWLGSLKEGEEQEKVELGRFESRRLDEFLPRKPGFILNAGGAVMGLDWCPLPHPPSPVEYLAITTISSASASISRALNPGPSLIQLWSLDMSTPSDFAIETDEEEGGQGIKMVMGLCVEEGDAWEVKWCPRGGNGEEGMQVDGEEGAARLGILAGAFADGSVSLFAVPDPVKAREEKGVEEDQVLYIKAKPILKLTLPDSRCDSLAWASHETIAAGCSNGHIAIWDVGSALRSGAESALPLQYFPAHTTSIRSLSFLRTPPLHRSLDGSLDADAEPVYLSSAGHDGSTMLIDLADTTAPIVITHDRGFIGAIEWSPHTGCMVTHDADAAVRLVSIKARDFASTRAIVKLTGVVQNLATSDHHPFVAAASADGACTLANPARTSKKKAYKGHYYFRVFRLDFNRELGEYRMVDNLHVESHMGIDATLRPPSKATSKNEYAAIVGAWAPQINVSRVSWHPSLNRACLLASGTSSGLVRVDWVEGGAPGS